MRDAFGAAALVEDVDDLLAEMTCHDKDRHVLAAAVGGGADVLVTFNVKAFPKESVAQHDIEVVGPDAYLERLLLDERDEVLAALTRGAATLR